MLGTHSGNFSPDSALEFLTLPTPFGEIVPSVLGRLSESSNGESFSRGGRRNVPCSLASLVYGGLLELGPNPPPGGFTPARPTVWSSLGTLRWGPASSPVPGKSCLCLCRAFWETLGPCREPGGGALPRRCVYGGLTRKGAPLLRVYMGGISQGGGGGGSTQQGFPEPLLCARRCRAAEPGKQSARRAGPRAESFPGGAESGPCVP